MRADDAAELRFDRLPEAIRAVGMLPAQVQADRLEVLRIDGVHHHGAIPLLSFDRAGAECQIVGVRRDQRISFPERQRVVAGPAIVARIGRKQGSESTFSEVRHVEVGRR